ETEDMDPVVRQGLDRIDANGTHLLSLVNDILDFSKIEAEEIQITPESRSPGKLLAETIGSLESMSSRKGLKLVTEVSPSVPRWVWIDPVRFRQILLNLTNNAIKFTEEGSVSVSLDYEPADERLICSVR